MKSLLTIIMSFAICIAIASCGGKAYNNHIMNSSTDSASLSAGKAIHDSATRMDAVAPTNTDTTGEQTGHMNNAPQKDTMGKKMK